MVASDDYCFLEHGAVSLGISEEPDDLIIKWNSKSGWFWFESGLFKRP
jgi:hypothetical protein